MQQKFKIADTCGVHNLHGMPGVIGGIVSAIMAAVATTDLYKHSLYNHYTAMRASNTTEMNDYISSPGYGRTAGQQAGYQLIALAVTLVIAIVGGLVTGKDEHSFLNIKLLVIQYFLFTLLDK